MIFAEKDEKFIKQVQDTLVQAQKIAINRNIGSMPLSPVLDDTLHPKVTISNQEIKQLTDRAKLRDVAVTRIVEKIAENGYFKAEKTEGGITVEVRLTRDRNIDFPSLEAMAKKNDELISKDPELDEPIDW